jgi:transposase
MAAGASRREAARRVGIHHSQIARWVSRGDRVAGSWSRYATFAEAVHLAEDAHDPPLLVALTNKFNSMDATEAWKFLQQNEPGFARRPDPEPVKVTVTFGPTVEGDSA